MSVQTKALLAGCAVAAAVVIYVFVGGQPDNPAPGTVTPEQKAAGSAAFRSGKFDRPQPGKYEWTPADAPKQK